jgi:hypothetical protein
MNGVPQVPSQNTSAPGSKPPQPRLGQPLAVTRDQTGFLGTSDSLSLPCVNLHMPVIMTAPFHWVLTSIFISAMVALSLEADASCPFANCDKAFFMAMPPELSNDAHFTSGKHRLLELWDQLFLN